MPVGDCGALAEAMRELILDAALRSRPESGAKKTTEWFRYENVIRQWEEIFEEP